MSYAKEFRYDAFVSYAHVDDQPSTGATAGWVSAFTQELRVRLTQKLGRADVHSIWKDEQLVGNRPVTPELTEMLRDSAVLISIVSPGYLNSQWCLRELNTFVEFDQGMPRRGSRVFVIERDALALTDRPSAIRDVRGYRFWERDSQGVARTLSPIMPEYRHDLFHDRMSELVDHIAQQLKSMKEKPVTVKIAPAETPAVQEASDTSTLCSQLRVERLAPEMRNPEESVGLFVGVGEFDLRSYLARLRYAVDDAIALAHLFVLDLGLISPSRATLALGGKPTSQCAGTWLEALRIAGVTLVPATRSELLLATHELGDAAKLSSGMVVVTFSSHGYDDEGIVYLLPQDGLRRFTRETGLPLPLICSALRATAAPSKLLLVDACRSPVEGAIKGAEAMTTEFERALKSADGLAVLSSCSAGQSSWESPELGLGVFTHFLREGLLGGAQPRPEDGAICLENVFAYAVAGTNQFVRKHIKLEQLPWCGGKDLVKSVPFAISREAKDRATRVAHAHEEQEKRKQNGVRLLFEARVTHRSLFPAHLQDQVESDLDLLEGDKLDELLDNLEKLADKKPSSCKLFSAWWESEHATTTRRPSTLPGRDAPWVNSLGMKFVPVKEMLFCIYPTIVQDFREFFRDSGYQPPAGHFFTLQDGQWKPGDFSWSSPGFKQGPTHPAVGVTWDDANAFCQWITARERREGVLNDTQFYALPSDKTWSNAVGRTKFPWGNDWPPTAKSGNYAANVPVELTLRDSSARSPRSLCTTPVGSFPPNKLGIYDLGGNVWEWCADWYNKEMNPADLRGEFDFLNDDGGGEKYHFLRGASWFNHLERDLRSDYRNPGKYPDSRFSNVGFRCVLHLGDAKDSAFHL